MIRSLTLIALLWLGLIASAHAWTPEEFSPDDLKSVQAAIDFLKSNPETAEWGAAAEKHLADGKLKKKKREKPKEKTDSETNNETNEVCLDPDLLRWLGKAGFEGDNCLQLYPVYRLAISIMHEMMHTRQGKWHRTCSCLWDWLGGHTAETTVWGNTMLAIDNVIARYRDNRKKNGASLKDLRKEHAMVTVKAELLSSYQNGNKPDYGKMSLAPMALPHRQDGDPVPPPDEDPVPGLIVYLEDQAKELKGLIDKLTREELEQGAPQNLPPNLGSDAKEPPHELVPPPAGLQEGDCELSWTGQGRLGGHVLDLTVKNKTDRQVNFPFVAGVVLGGGAGASRIVVMRREFAKIAPGATETLQVNGFCLDPERGAPAAGQPIRLEGKSMREYLELANLVNRGLRTLGLHPEPVSGYYDFVIESVVLDSLGRFQMARAKQELLNRFGDPRLSGRLQRDMEDVQGLRGPSVAPPGQERPPLPPICPPF